MQICNKCYLLCWEHDLNKPDRAKDGWMETPNSPPCRDAAVGRELSVCLRLPTAVLPQSIGWPIIGQHLFSQQMGGYPCQSFGVMPLWPLGAPWEGARLLTPAVALSQGHMGLVCSGHRTNHWHRPVVTKVDCVQCSCTVHLWLSKWLRSAFLSQTCQQMTMKEHADDSSFT